MPAIKRKTWISAILAAVVAVSAVIGGPVAAAVSGAAASIAEIFGDRGPVRIVGPRVGK